MKITVPAELEKKIRDRAKAEGLSVEAYLEQLVRADERRKEESYGPDVACGEGTAEEVRRKLEAIRTAALHEAPTADIETMLAEIEGDCGGEG
ncbi:MAG: hypothetical protein WA857_16300 [Candidatus Acidiferrum sp.]